jgi:DNA-binding transcriptional MocR family regulator
MKAFEITTHSKTGISIEVPELALREGLVDACLFIPDANNPLSQVMPDTNKKGSGIHIADLPVAGWRPPRNDR